MVIPGPPAKRHLTSVPEPVARSWELRYGVAVLSAALAFILSTALHPDSLPALFLLMLGAVALSAWFGGARPALLATGIGVGSGMYLLYPAFGFAQPEARVHLVLLAAFILAALLICRMNAGLRRAQDEVRYSQAHLAGVVQISEDAIISVDEDQRIRLFNRGAEKIFGYQAEEVLGEPLAILIPKKYAAAHYVMVQRFAGSPDALRTMHQRSLIQGLRKDGTEFPAEASISKLEVAGEKMMTVRLRDVTERIRTENVLRLNEKLAATGRLAATIAHEINNPLESVTNLLFLLQYHTGLDDIAREYVTTASAELARVVHIARQTLGFYRDSSAPVPVKVSTVLEDVLDLYSRKAQARNIDIGREFEYDSVVIGFPGELRQIFSNLVSNALEAIAHDGKVRVHVYRSRLWQDGRRDGVRVTIADNGPGISEQHRSKVFEPFFTTKSEKGTGLGLWVARGIVQKHGGAINVHSTTRAGRHGTCFSVFLPADTREPARKLAEATAA